VERIRDQREEIAQTQLAESVPTRPVKNGPGEGWGHKLSRRLQYSIVGSFESIPVMQRPDPNDRNGSTPAGQLDLSKGS
jgi:hypothetical protein